MRKITGDRAVSGCGAVPVAGAVTLGLGQSGAATFAGLSTCTKIHLCPVCSGRVRSERAAELDAYAKAWQAAGGGLAMMTLTMRHYKRFGLKPLVKKQHEAWRAAFGAGGRPWRKLQNRFGISGYVRAWECTHGGNGWHPHWHVLLFLDTPWSQQQAAEFWGEASARWTTALEKAGAHLPSKERGVRVDRSTGPDDGALMAKYLMKYQGEAAAPGKELTRSDLKKGRSTGRTPFEILADAGRALDRLPGDTPRGDIADVRLWREYESAVHNVRALHWSTGMRERLQELLDAADDRDDAELAADEPVCTPVAVFPVVTWREHIISTPRRKLALAEACERGGVSAVKTLCWLWGLTWGVDVLPPSAAQYVDDRARAADEDRCARSQPRPGVRRHDARLDVAVPAAAAAAPVPVQQRLELDAAPPRPTSDELADIRERMNAANRQRAEAGLSRLRRRGAAAGTNAAV